MFNAVEYLVWHEPVLSRNTDHMISINDLLDTLVNFVSFDMIYTVRMLCSSVGL